MVGTSAPTLTASSVAIPPQPSCMTITINTEGNTSLPSIAPTVFNLCPNFCAITVKAAKTHLLRLVVMDEVHLHTQHGSSFCEDILRLKEVFSRPTLSPKVASVSLNYIPPQFLATTRSIANDYTSLFLSLTTIGISHRNIHWSSP